MTPSFQRRVAHWLKDTFGEEAAADKAERNYRFLEEALELVQSLGLPRYMAHQMVDYVFDRPSGKAEQEVGGTLTTLAAICHVNGIDLQAAGEAELTRMWNSIDEIRAKQAQKPVMNDT